MEILYYLFYIVIFIIGAYIQNFCGFDWYDENDNLDIFSTNTVNLVRVIIGFSIVMFSLVKLGIIEINL